MAIYNGAGSYQLWRVVKELDVLPLSFCGEVRILLIPDKIIIGSLPRPVQDMTQNCPAPVRGNEIWLR